MRIYWPQIANEKHKKAPDFQSCTVQGTRNGRQKELRQFTDTGPLKYLVMDIRSPLSKEKSGIHYVIVFTNRYTELTGAIQVTKVTLTDAATDFE